MLYNGIRQKKELVDSMKNPSTPDKRATPPARRSSRSADEEYTPRHAGRTVYEPERPARSSRPAGRSSRSEEQAAPMKTSTKILLLLLCSIFVGVFAFSGYKLYSIYHGYRSSERQYSSLSERYTTAASPTPVPTAEPYAAAPETPATPEVETSPIQVDFGQLQAECSDIVGWIYSEGTPINYPIVQSQYDNPAIADYYYLYRDIHGEYSGNGTPFLDVKCAGDFSFYNSIVYGHHMKDGSMFASLDNYRTAGYYEQHPVMYLNTPQRNYKIEIFAGYVCDADSSTDSISFPDESSFLIYCRDMKAQSDFQSPVEIQPGDTIITLSTCSYEWHDARYVIQGRLVPLP